MEQQQGLGGAGGPGAAGPGAGRGLDAAAVDEQAGPGLELLHQASRGDTVAVLAAVDQDKRLLTRAGLAGWTLLHYSCMGGQLELAGALLVRGADAHAKDSLGGDACLYACGSGNLALAAFRASPHPRELKRRKEKCFAPRAVLMAVVVGCGFCCSRPAAWRCRWPAPCSRHSGRLLARGTGHGREAPCVLAEILSNMDLVRRFDSFL